ncbi:hypothetical protein CSV77_04950 [Sporosarcina sp. P16b]|uniref:DUF1829 domain-containing protein n=1 Tax=Sporosarcina sp. P16b TaxID=2048261 RepID=UPI000C16EFC4|nr:DUF1829 domain-containing protein [Sporosarcina sp. P16b]PIC71379.1 hypothetical protein CSV77_04950 [Sporosarcina sp. P16b]
MTSNIAQNSYFKWIQENTTFSDVLHNAVEISSPFTDSLNENIKIYIETNSDQFKVTDGGFTIWSLEATGMSFRKGTHRQNLLHTLIGRLNVHLEVESNELFIMTDKNNLGKAIHQLIQAILSVSDLLWYGKKTIKNLFFEEVTNYFRKHDDIFDPFPDIEIQGKSRLSHHFDYLMNVHNREKKLVRLINHLDQTQLERTLLSWSDTSKQRESKYGENLGMVALINDKDKTIPSKYLDAFQEYKIEPVGFYDKPSLKKALSLTG